MSNLWIFLYLASGILFLYGGAEFLIKGSSSLALRWGLSPLLIGLTIMGYGTGTPELIVSVQASLIEQGDIALGNVVGSNVANMGLILGTVALIKPLSVDRKIIRFDLPIMMASTLVLLALGIFNSHIGRLEGAILVLLLVVYSSWSIIKGREKKAISAVFEKETYVRPHQFILTDVIFIFGGFLTLFWGGSLFLEGAIGIAERFAISNAVIGLTVVALGTSLPEFATSVVAMIRKQEELAIGNIIGSNIFNILGIVGLASFIHPIEITGIGLVDFGYLALLSAFMWLSLGTGSRLFRWEATLMLLSYFGFIIYLLRISSFNS